MMFETSLKRFFHCLLAMLLFTAGTSLWAQASPPSPPGLDAATQAVLQALKNKDGRALAKWVDPERGLRFMPYPWDYLPKTVLLQAREVERIYQSKTKRVWGLGDGSGDPIQLTGSQYIRRFVWNVDYTKVVDQERLPLKEHLDKAYAYRGGNEDVLELFPEAWSVTYFFPGITGPQGGAMDWSWLTLIFIPRGGEWRLVGLVHKEWTI